MAQTRTSFTDPLRIAEVRHDAFPGALGITFCPGKKQRDGWSGIWNRDLATDLDVIRQWGTTAVISLIEDHEIAALQVQGLGSEIMARGMEWHHLPIVDVSVPDQSFEAGWMSSRAPILGRLRAGQRVVVHCKGGLGRAGMISAQILIELGVPAELAISIVRRARPHAIQTPEQERYIREYAAPK